MEYIIFALLVALLIIFLSFKSDLSDRIYRLESGILDLKRQLESLSSSIPKSTPPVPTSTTKQVKSEPIQKTEKDYW